MSSRPFKELSDKYLTKIKEIKSSVSYSPETPESFSRTVDNLLEYQDNDTQNNSNDIKKEYRHLYNIHARYISEEHSIKRIENQAHRRALIFRFLTTLGIGFGIMLVYYVSQKLGINMPLLRFAL